MWARKRRATLIGVAGGGTIVSYADLGCLPVRLAIVNNEQEQRILVKRLMGSATAWNGTGQNVQNIPFLVQNEAKFGRDGGNLSPGN